jgi:DNA polymerase-1
LPHTEVAVAVKAASVPEDALFAPDPGWGFAVHPDGADTVLIGQCERPEDLVEAVGTRPVIAHDAKSLGLVPQNLAHDTEVAA